MKLLKLNARKLFALLLALVASFALIACDKSDEVTEELEAAIGSITIGDTSALVADFKVSNTTNRHEMEIKWELVDADDTLKLEKEDDSWTKVIVKPTKYTEDEEGNQTNPWGYGILKATVEKDGKSASRQWDLHVSPGIKTEVLKIRDVKRVDNKKKVELNGTVILTKKDGFIVEDETGAIHVFLKAAPDADIKPGAKVNVKGEKDLYLGQPQVSNPVVDVLEKAPASGYDYTEVEEMSISDLNKFATEDLDHFGKLIKITGMVIKEYMSPTSGAKAANYAIKDVNTNEVAAIIDDTNDDVKQKLESKVGEYVSIVIVVYEFHSQYEVWRHFGVPGTVESAEAPVLSDEEIVASTKSELLARFNNKSFALDLELPTTNSLDATITWTSSEPTIIANDGTLTNPNTDTVVEFTVKVTSGDVEETFTIKVTALAIETMTVKEAIDAIDGGASFVVTEGVIIGQDVDGYYYLADSTGVIYVRQKLSANNLVIGNKVKVMGEGSVFTGTNNAQFTRQISGGSTYFVEKLDDQIHESPLAAVDAQITDFDFTIKSDDVTTKVPEELLYGKVVRFEAFVITHGQFNNVYLADSLEANSAKIGIYYKSMAEADLKELIGVKVTITAVVYDYHVQDGWRLGFLNREGDLEFELNTEQKLAKAEAELGKIITNNMEVNTDLDFITETNHKFIPGTKYVWTTNNLDVLAVDGKFTHPTDEVQVVVTVKVFLDGDTTGTADKELSFTVKAKPEGASVTFTETFDNASIGGSYSEGSFVGVNGVEWTYGHSRDEGDFAIDGKGIMLRRASDSFIEATIDGGLSKFTLEYRKAFTGATVRQLEIIITHSGGEERFVTPEFGPPSGADDTVHTFLADNLEITGEFTVKIKNVGEATENKQLVIDNISWSTYSGK